MAKMTKEEYAQFMLEGTKTGKLATVREDGRPHVTPIWYLLDGEDLVFTTHKDTVKAKNMKRDSRASMAIDDQTPPYSYVVVEGTVSFSEDPEELLNWATKIGGRYMGEDQAEAFGRRNAVEGEMVVRLTPTKVIAHKDIAAW